MRICSRVIFRFCFFQLTEGLFFRASFGCSLASFFSDLLKLFSSSRKRFRGGRFCSNRKLFRGTRLCTGAERLQRAAGYCEERISADSNSAHRGMIGFKPFAHFPNLLFVCMILTGANLRKIYNTSISH